MHTLHYMFTIKNVVLKKTSGKPLHYQQRVHVIFAKAMSVISPNAE